MPACPPVDTLFLYPLMDFFALPLRAAVFGALTTIGMSGPFFQRHRLSGFNVEI
jgi:hypothetical protein